VRIFSLGLVIILLLGKLAYGGDYVRIGVDSIPSGVDAFKIEFFVDRSCPDPDWITGISLGFTLTTTGTVEFRYRYLIPYPSTENWVFNWVINPSLPIDWGTSGQILCGGASMPPGGMPVLDSEQPLWDLYLDVRGVGELLIDSAFVPTHGVWKLLGLTCGLGGAPDRPLFIAKDSSDIEHPVRIVVYEPLCGDADLSQSVDVDDVVYLISYIFAGAPAPCPIGIADTDCSGGVDIDDAVYLISYIFSSGNAPCDIDGDGYPNC